MLTVYTSGSSGKLTAESGLDSVWRTSVALGRTRQVWTGPARYGQDLPVVGRTRQVWAGPARYGQDLPAMGRTRQVWAARAAGSTPSPAPLVSRPSQAQPSSMSGVLSSQRMWFANCYLLSIIILTVIWALTITITCIKSLRIFKR